MHEPFSYHRLHKMCRLFVIICHGAFLCDSFPPDFFLNFLCLKTCEIISLRNLTALGVDEVPFGAIVMIASEFSKCFIS